MKRVTNFLILIFGLTMQSCIPPGNLSEDYDTSDKNFYYITYNGGDIYDTKNDLVAGEYSRYLMAGDEYNYKIYFGGSFVGHQSYEITNFWIEDNQGLYLTKSPLNVKYDSDNRKFWSGVLNFSQAPAYDIFGNNNTYSLIVHVGNTKISEVKDANGNTDYVTTYNSLGQQTFEIEVVPFDGRYFNYFVYQQQRVAEFSKHEQDIENAFLSMGVTAIGDDANDLNGNAIPLLTDAVIDHDEDPETLLENDPLMIYAYKQLYPSLPTLNAFQSFFQKYILEGGRGLLFIIKDYKSISSNGTTPPKDRVGLTLRYDDGFPIPVTSFVFGDRINGINSQWLDMHYNCTIIHELGHQWCYSLIDEATHELWHNGDNKERCIMHGVLEFLNGDPNPSTNTEKILKFHNFCEGHLQRGMNTAWKIQQYFPSTNNSINNNSNLFASLSNTLNGVEDSHTDILTENNFQLNNLKIELEIDTSEFIKGKIIEAVLHIINNGNEDIKINPKEFNYKLNHLSKGKILTGRLFKISSHSGEMLIKSGEEYISQLNLTGLINYNETNNQMPGWPWYYWYEGDYELSINISKEIETNNIRFTVNPIPQELLEAFEGLKSSLTTPDILDPETYEYERIEHLFEKYKESFFGKEYFVKLLTAGNYYAALTNQPQAQKLRERAKELCSEFILKYPNSYYANLLYKYLTSKKEINKEIINNIYEELKKQKSTKKILFKRIEESKEKDSLELR